MAIVENLGPYRVVDLSKPIDPATEKRRCNVTRFYQERTKDYYSYVDVHSHLGTHVEVPNHFRDDLPDAADMSATSFMGRGVVMELDIAPKALITAKDLDAADKGRVKPGDVVILKSPYHCEPFSFDPSDPRPHLCRESAEWFASKQIKCLGFGDSVAIENIFDEAFNVHDVLMPLGISFLEVMQNLDELKSDIFMIVFLPMPIKTVDSCCVRAVAIEGVPGFSA